VTALLCLLATLVLVYGIWMVTQRNWGTLRHAYETLPDRIRRALIILVAAAALLTSRSVRVLAQGAKLREPVADGWLLLAAALVFVLFRAGER